MVDRSRQFKPRDLGAILDSKSEEDEHLVESLYWPHVTRVGERIALAALARPTISLEPFGEIAQEAFQRSRTRSNVDHIKWDDDRYLAYPAGVHRFENVLLHSKVGLICYGETVVSETLWHTDTKLHHYEWSDGKIIVGTDNIKPIRGRTLSLLGRADNYFHSVIDGIARLALISDVGLTGIDNLLIPEDGMGQAELLRLHGLPPNVTVVQVTAHDTFEVENLLFPFSLHGLFDFTPQLNAFFDRVLARVPAQPSHPTHIYIDRRGGSLRRLTNEDDVVRAMEQIGFHIARLEDLNQVDQIALFQNAKMIVGPHGAGLTNIAFSRPGTVLIELMMDAYCNWCYRRLAHIRGVKYDCVLGHALGDWKDEQSGAIHGQAWEVSVPSLTATVESLMPWETPRRRQLNIFGVFG